MKVWLAAPIERLARRLAALALAHPRRNLAVACAVAAVTALGAFRLSFDPDILDLVPSDNPVVADFRRILEEMGTIDVHAVVVEVPRGQDPAAYEPLIDALAARYRELPTVAGVQHRLPEPVELLELVLPHALLLLDPGRLDEVAAALSDEGIAASVARNRRLLQTPQGASARELIENDPFGLLPLFLERFADARGTLRLEPASGYYLSRDHRLFLLLVEPRRPAQELKFARRFLAEARQAERRALADFRRAAGGVPLPAIGATGGYAIGSSDADLIRRDVVINVVTSSVGVLALFLYAFRRPAALAYAGLPLALALATTFGLAGFLLGELSSSSATFGALVAGLGVDFVTVLYERYSAERRRGIPLDAALHHVLVTMLPGVFFAALTTAATFYAYVATEFRGMSELGFLTATGLLVYLAYVLVVLPALLVVTDHPDRRGKPAHAYAHRTFGSDGLVRRALARPRLVLAAWALFALACLPLLPRLEFTDDVANLRAKGNRGVAMQRRVTASFGQTFNYLMLVVEADDPETLLARTERVTARLRPLVENGTLASVQSIAAFLPPAARQREVMQALAAGRADRFSFPRIAATLRRELARQGFRPDVYDGYLALFARALAPARPVGVADLDDPRFGGLARRFVEPASDGGYLSVVYLHPRGGSWRRHVPAALRETAAAEPHATLTGIVHVTQTLRGIIWRDAARATALGFAIVFAIFLIAYRSLLRAALLFVPFLFGAVGMLGVMALLGLEFNFLNIYIGLFLVGVATDYAVYMLQRWLESPAGFAAGAAETGRAIVMAALTTMIGFGSFVTSHYPGLRSIGYATALGVGLSCLASITLMPVLLDRLRRE